MRRRVVAASLLLASWLAARLAAEAGGIDSLPVNHWAKLPCKPEPGYVWSALVYVPSRGQILHWGATADPAHSRDDVRAFDLATMDWVSDYTSAPASVLRKSADPESGKSVRVWGLWGMLPETGRPAPSWTVNAVTYDSKRKQLVFALRGMMAAYDPAARTWRDLKAETELNGKWSLNPSTPYGMYEHGLRPEQDFHNHRILGPPPVYGAGICYDPTNDEILLFPHWGSQNNDLRPFTGRVSGHSGTWIYSFRDNLWRRPFGPGPERTRGARQDWLAQIGKVNRVQDELWRVRRRPPLPQEERLRRLGQELAGVRSQLPGWLGEPIAPGWWPRRWLGSVSSSLKFASDATLQAEMDGAVYFASGGLMQMDAILELHDRIEPPPRCGAAMFWDEGHKAVLLVGGQNGFTGSDPYRLTTDPGNLDDVWAYSDPGCLNDVWAYTSNWRELTEDWGNITMPPSQGLPKLAYDPMSKKALLVALPGIGCDKGPVVLWSLDPFTAGWFRRHEEPWPWGGTGWSSVSVDPKNRLLLLVRDGKEGQETFAFRFDLDKLPRQHRNLWQPRLPLDPQRVYPDEAIWLAKLKHLPANTWVPAKPPFEPSRRDWGTLACDPVRGLVFYFGGGHATYQINDVAIYAVGSNSWLFADGDRNSPIPPHNWDGCTMGFRGGPPAGHQRNSYLALDGRMFVHAGTHSRRWDAEIAKEKGIRVAWFYDLDRGGVWRQREIEKVALGEGVPGSYGRLHVADPAGKLYGFAGHLEPYDGRFFSKEAYFSTYDVYDNTLTVRKIPEPTPGWVGECRPFCMLPDRKQVFFYECRKDGGHATWVYDIAANRFTDLKPPHQPPAEPRTVEYIDAQKCVLAIVGQGEQWVYSLEKSDWSPLPLKVEGGTMRFQTPYAQMVWVAKYGVLVNVCGSTWLMRPESRP